MKQIIYLIIFTLFACNDKELHDSDIIQASYTLSNTSFYDIFDDIKLIRLETNDQSLMIGIDKIIIYQNRIYILDKQQSTVFFFGKNGEYINKISRIGQGPGEYSLISDFIIDQTDNRIMILSPFGILYNFDLNANFINEYTLPSNIPNYQLVENLDNDHLISWSIVTSEEDGINIISKKDASIVNGYWTKNMVINSFTSNVFYKYNGSVYFSIGLLNDVYRLNNNNLELAYKWHFKEDNIDINEDKIFTTNINVDKDCEKIADQLKRGKIPYIFTQQSQTNEFYYAQLMLNLKDKINIFHYKNKNKNYCFRTLKEGLELTPVEITNDHIINIVSYSEQEKYCKSNILQNDDLLIMKTMNNDDNPLLAIFKLKK